MRFIRVFSLCSLAVVHIASAQSAVAAQGVQSGSETGLYKKIDEILSNEEFIVGKSVEQLAAVLETSGFQSRGRGVFQFRDGSDRLFVTLKGNGDLAQRIVITGSQRGASTPRCDPDDFREPTKENVAQCWRERQIKRG